MGMVKLLFSTAHNPDSAISKVENYYSVTRHAAITQEALHFLGLEQKRKLIGGPGAANCGSSGSDEVRKATLELGDNGPHSLADLNPAAPFLR